MNDLSDSTVGRELGTIFLDRDGVVNHKMPEGCYVTSWADFQVLPGVPEAIARLNRAGLRVIVLSNQRGIALGLYTATDVDVIHACFHDTLKPYGAHVDAFYFCPHDRQQCNCRKPMPGLFEQAKEDFPEIDATASAMIGDSLSDMEFGRRLGMLTVFIQGDPQRQKRGAQKAGQLADLRCPSLSAAVDALLAKG